MEAPLRGTPAGARDRRLVVLASGEEAIFRRCKPLLEATGRMVNLLWSTKAPILREDAQDGAGGRTRMSLPTPGIDEQVIASEGEG